MTILGVERVGEITHSLGESELEQFSSRINEDGLKMYRALFKNEVWLGSREGTLKFKVTGMDGEELGSTTIEFAND